MKVVFNKDGKYRIGGGVAVVTKADIENKKVFDVSDSYAIEFIHVKLAYDAVDVKEPEPENGFDLDVLTIAELKEFAAANKIDIGEAKKKSDILDIVESNLVDSE